MLVQGTTVIRFSGPGCILSNLNFHDIVLRGSNVDLPGPDDRVFLSSEHAYHWTKLHFLGLHNEAEDFWDDFRSVNRPADAFNLMRAGRFYYDQALASSWDAAKDDLARRLGDWRDLHATQVLEDLVMRKARTNFKLHQFLGQNSDKWFVEATPHKIWGYGSPDMPKADDDFLKAMKGENRMGKIHDRCSFRISEGFAHRWEFLNYSTFLATPTFVVNYST